MMTTMRATCVLLMLAACDRAPERATDSAAVLVARDTAPRAPRAPEIPQYRELWFPLWQIALDHTDSIHVQVSQPMARCQPAASARLARDGERQESNAYGNLIVAITNEPFDTIARVAGFERRGDRWVTVGTDGNARDAIEVAGTSSRMLRGAGLGAAAPAIPRPAEPRMRDLDTNALRHHAFVATVEHPRGCTVVMRYLHHFEGGEDTAAVRRIVESVRLGPDAITKPFPDSVADAQGIPEEDTTQFDHTVGGGDSGIGLVIFDDSAAVETVTVYTARDRQSAVILRIARDMETRLSVVNDTTIALTAFEYGYEIDGLVVDQLALDSSWARI